MPNKVNGWSGVFTVEGIDVLATVQAKTRKDAISKLTLVGFEVTQPQQVDRTTTVRDDEPLRHYQSVRICSE